MSDESRVDELFLRVADLEPQERERGRVVAVGLGGDVGVLT